MKWSKALVAEFLGSMGLLMIVVGSGIMGEELAQGNQALALLANSLATGAGLFALIQTFESISGAHFNPAVSFIQMLRKKLTPKECISYVVVQIAGAIIGVFAAHVMFGLNVLQLSSYDRGELRFGVSEIVATFGLVTVISLSGKSNAKAAPMAIALYIASAYWWTSSTSFANPAVTIARCLTDTFSGVLWTGAPMFIVAQLGGAFLAYGLSKFLGNSSRDIS